MSNELSRPQMGGLQLQTFDHYWRFAETVCQSGMAPKGANPAGVLVCMQYGAEIGLSPMQSIQNIACINGKPGLYGDGMLAVCRASGLFDDAEFKEIIEGNGDSMQAVCRVRRKPDGQVTETVFSVAMAKRAGLWGKQGPWKQYPERMLQMRARSFALRDTFPDVLKGLIAVEELQDYPESKPIVEVVENPRPAIKAEPPKPKKTLYGEHGERLREMLYEEGADSREAADAMVQIWSGGLHQSAKRVMEDENESQALLEVIQQQRQFEQSEEQTGDGQLFGNEPETKNPLEEGV